MYIHVLCELSTQIGKVRFVCLSVCPCLQDSTELHVIQNIPVLLTHTVQEKTINV